jgi:hypothetical protein
MIVLSSVIAAVVVAVALAVPEVANAPRDAIGRLLLPHSFALAVAALATYGLCAIFLAAVTLIVGAFQIRHYLLRPTTEHNSAERSWIAAFGVSGFRQLAPKLAPMLVEPGGSDGRIALQAWFSPKEIRSEIARLYYISLARCHFFSAVILLAGVVGLGLAQDRASLPFFSVAIPTASAILTLVGLVLLAALGRIVIDVTAEPLIETAAQLSAERAEIGLLRRAVELLETARDAWPAKGHASVASTTPELSAELFGMIERDHYALLDALDRLTTNTDALQAAVRSACETLAASADKFAVPDSILNMIVDLRGAVEGLKEAILHLPTHSPEHQEGRPSRPLARPQTREPQLARELQNLLREIGTS